MRQKNIKSSICDYSDAYIFVTIDIRATCGAGNTDLAFKNCASCTNGIAHINDEHIDTAESIDITISMFNLIEYSNYYPDTSGSLWQFKRNEQPLTDTCISRNANDSSSFKYKSSTLGKPAAVGNNGALKNGKIFVLLKYICNFWRSF